MKCRYGYSLLMYAHIYLVPRPHYCARQIRFGSRSPRIHHRSELTEKAWENAAQGQDNGQMIISPTLPFL